jgi:hypothetical protein
MLRIGFIDNVRGSSLTLKYKVNIYGKCLRLRLNVKV